MTNAATLLARIPDHLKPLAALILGGFMLIFIVIFHGAGLHLILTRRKRFERAIRQRRPYILPVLLLFAWSIFLALTLHIVEFAIWAWALIELGLVAHTYDAIYFCANAYTTLGASKIDLDPLWRNISPVIATSGLFTFAWTTSALASVVTSHYQLLDQVEEGREKEAHMRSTLRKEEWDAIEKERTAEELERDKARQEARGATFFQRRAIWKAERKDASELRKASESEVGTLHRTEREAEEKLGPGDPPNADGKK